MTLTLGQLATAVGLRASTTFYGVGGTAPYTFAVLAGGAGGTVDAATGVYTAPSSLGTDPRKTSDTVQVTDSATPTPATATAAVLVCSPVMLLGDILQQGLGLANGRVYLWNQRIPEPSDAGLFIAVSVPVCKPYASIRRFNADTGTTDQYLSMQAVVDLDLISRDSSARDRKEEAVLALNSDYALSQQYANAFRLALIPGSFVDASQVDGAAIPYRYRISVKMLYTATKSQNASYYTSLNFQATVDGGATVAGTIAAGTAPAPSDPIISGGGAT